MSWNLWLLYVSLAGALIVSPGPSALLCVSHGVSHGVRRTLGTVLGGITASMPGVALKNGRKGDVIKVRNSSSQRIISGVVDDTGVVTTLAAE